MAIRAMAIVRSARFALLINSVGLTHHSFLEVHVDVKVASDPAGDGFERVHGE